MMNTMKTSIKRPRFASSPLPMMVMGWIAGASSLACAQGLAAAGLAEPPGWRIGLGQSIGRDDNLLRLPAVQDPQADTAANTTLDLAWRGEWGRQQASAYGRLDGTRHRGSGVLDHTAHRAGAIWDFETAGELSGRLLARRQFDLAPDDLRIEPLSGRRNEQQIEQALALLRWNARGRLGLELLRQHDAVRETASWSLLRNFSQDTSSLGLLWRSHGGSGAGGGASSSGGGAAWGGWELGLAWREVDGRQPASAVQPEATEGLQNRVPELDYRQRLLDLQGRIGGSSAAALAWRWARGHGDRAVTLASGSSDEPATPTRLRQDLNSLMLEARWRWLPSWTFVARSLRDQGQQARVLEPLTATANLTALSASDTRDARVEIHWEPGPRWQAYATGGRTQRRWQQGLGLQVGGNTAPVASDGLWQDTTWRTRVGLRWSATSTWSVRCHVGQDRRGAPRAVESAAELPTVGLGGWRSRSVECGVRWDSHTV